ncbi:hypothetical protein SUGI_1453320 [Cryptomeria japonica]|uniref:Protein kinase domain-containing protein n=2 Tax=Cryptomeria japonica TaxID=3369 RepID=A0AAD3NV65_CRYJA|nr:hypothetical protein SUGI_1453300 [Cryptomeria japonica]GLJ58497.1 hypothetical protein SUGI_1453310 [Cryptomeria japonica]GLJ58498.1 hypothetical protein SUGI_1453320 [Cryptomeria japonica]
MPVAAILSLFTSIKSPLHQPMSRFNLLYAFILYTLLLPCSLCADVSYTNCESNQTCGGIKIPYPFGLRESGCGLPDLQVDCEDKGHLVIEIGNQRYTILNFFPDNQTSTITEDTSFQNCSFSYNLNEDAIQDGGLFDQIQRHNISLQVLVCGLQCVALLPGLEVPGCYFKSVTVEEASTHWNIAEEQDQKCKSCVSSGGLCGFNISDLNQFLCFCEDAPHQTTCSSVERSIYRAITVRTKKGRDITGIAIGASAFIVIVALFLIVVYRKRSSYFRWIQSCVASEPMNSGSIGKVENFLQSYIHEMPTRYSFSQLKKITNDFSDKLGEGGFGMVYKGKLPSGFFVAVKLLDQSRQSESQFMNEVATLGTIHHVHLVRLMGYCFEGFRSPLVYEYMANGSLEKFLFQGKEQEQKLSWEQLYSIALGAARGIAYLHQDCNRRIIHFDIKPHNILLDADFTPKVADFGLAKLYGKGDDHVSITATRGTPGYVAPEVWNINLGGVTDKSDVYSFGMLLMEIAGRRKNIELQVSHSSQLYFPEWAFKLIESGELEKRLREKGRCDMEVEDEEKVRRMTKVGLWCIQYNSNDRPSMSRVVQMLEGNGDDVSNPPLPFNSSPPREVPLSSSSEEYSSVV